MMTHKRTLELREIQRVSKLLEKMHTGEPNWSLKWDGSTVYWMGRLSEFCESVTKRITDARNKLMGQFTNKTNDGGFEFKEENGSQKFSEAIKSMLDEKDTIRFPQFKASAFVKYKKDKQGKNTKEIEESLVPMEFWTTFSKYLEMDVEAFKVPEEEEEEVSEVEFEETDK